MDNLASIYGLAAGLGALLLLGFLTYGVIQSRRRDAEIDPRAPGDDPSRGLAPAHAAGRRPPMQYGLVAVLCLALLVVGGAWVFANSHLIAKGERDLPTAQEAATGQTSTRDPYTLRDFQEPRAQ